VLEEQPGAAAQRDIDELQHGLLASFRFAQFTFRWPTWRPVR
jgi:hypothetical protein